MSFADELRKPYINVKNYDWEDRRVEQCLGAITEKCLQSKKAGKSYIRGGFCCDDTDYGTYKIVENSGTVFTCQDKSWDYLQKQLIQGIKSLGFTQYNVIIKTCELKEQRGITLLGKPKMVANGKVGHLIYVEITW